MKINYKLMINNNKILQIQTPIVLKKFKKIKIFKF